MISCAILKLCFTFCLNQDPEAAHFLTVQNGIEVLQCVFKKIAKHSGFSSQFVDLLFKIIELPGMATAELGEIIPQFFEKLIFDGRIWCNSAFEVQEKLVQRAHEFLLNFRLPVLSSGKICRKILTMFYDYFSPEEGEGDSKVFLESMKTRLEKLLVDYLCLWADAKMVDALVEFLLLVPGYLYPTRNLLFVIMKFRFSTEKQRSWNEILVSHLQEIRNSKTKKFDLITVLHMLIQFGVSKKLRQSVLSITEDLAAQERRTACCEDIVAYSLHILLSLDWNGVWKVLSGKGEGYKGKTPTKKASLIFLPGLSKEGNRDSPFLEHLRDMTLTVEEVILNFLFHQRNPHTNKEESFSKCFLGLKTYHVLLSHLACSPAMFLDYTLAGEENELQARALQVSEKVCGSRRHKVVYGLVFKNLQMFELKVQRKILIDYNVFLGDENLKGMILEDKELFCTVCHYLSKKRYLEEKVMEGLLEKIYKSLLCGHWTNGHTIFWNERRLNEEGMLRVLDSFFDKMLDKINKFCKEGGMRTALQFAYFLEDVAIDVFMDNPLLAVKIAFLNVLAKFIIYLDKLELLYFWLPHFKNTEVIRRPKVDSRECGEREGGVVRVVLKLLFKCMLRVQYTSLSLDLQRIPFKLAKFFLFHDAKTLNSIKMTLQIEYKNASEESLGFLKKIENWKSSLALNMIFSSKTLCTQKPLKEVAKSLKIKKHWLNRMDFRLLTAYTLLAQALIYTSCDVTLYKDLLDKFCSYKVTRHTITLTKMIGRVAKQLVPLLEQKNGFFNELKEKYGKSSGLFVYAIKNCLSFVDKCSKDCIFKLHCCDERLAAGITIKDEENGSYLTTFEDFGHNLLELSRKILALFKGHVQKGMMKEVYAEDVTKLIISDSSIRDIQPKLHRLFTDDFLQVEKAVLAFLEYKATLPISMAYLKTQSSIAKQKVIKIQEKVKGYNEKIVKEFTGLHLSPETSRKKECEELKKRALAEFSPPQNELNAKVYQITGQYYQKLLNRCPLYKERKYLRKPLGFKSFVKLSSVKDNMGRAMRLKEIADPLENSFLLGRIAYVRGFLLKRLVVQRIANKKYKTRVGCTLLSTLSKDHYVLLEALMRNCVPMSRRGGVLSKTCEPEESKGRSSFLARTRLGPTPQRIKSCVSRVQLASECNVLAKPKNKVFTVEIIKKDKSIFGFIGIADQEIIFKNSFKDKDDNKYRLGPSKHHQPIFNSKLRKIWRYTDIRQITACTYNMIKQAVEIEFNNHKSVFLVFFSKQNLNLFLIHMTSIMPTIAKVKGTPIPLVRDLSRKFVAEKFTEEWRRGRLSNFEYLMALNKYSNRSMESLSQYPVFPWILQQFTGSRMNFSPSDFRNLSFTTAAINSAKREEGLKKYKNSDDHSEGQFQFGSHYLPGRGVLGYLMRLEPYTEAVYAFDSGGDDPCRHFHFVQVLWDIINQDSSSNLELIPEFYYLPEFLAN